MTDAFNLLMAGEYVWGILNPFTRIIGIEWTLFFLLVMGLFILYLKTESISLPLMVGITALASVRMSDLFEGTEYALIPEQFDVWVALFLAGSLAFMIFIIWTRK